jgi:hypothetical protein
VVVGFFFLLGAVHAAPGKPSFFPFSAKHHRPLEAVESPPALRIFHPRVSMTSTVTRGHEGTTGIGESAPPPKRSSASPQTNSRSEGRDLDDDN